MVLNVTDGSAVEAFAQEDLRIEIHETPVFAANPSSVPIAVAQLDECGRYRALDFSLPETIVVVARGADALSPWAITATRTRTPDEPPDDFDVFAISRMTDLDWSDAAFGGGPTFEQRGTTLFVVEHDGAPVAGVTASGSAGFPTIAYLTGDEPGVRVAPESEGPTYANGSVLATNGLDQIMFSGSEPPGCNWPTYGEFGPAWSFYWIFDVGPICP